MILTRSDSRNRSRQDDYKKRRNNSGDQKSDRPAKRAKRAPRDKSKSSKGNPSLPSYTDRTCQELELPPILVLALKDQKAVEMVENTGICIDVERLNRIPVGGRIRFAKENWKIITPERSFAAKVVDKGFKIDWIGKPKLPLNLKNPHTDPEGQAVLDKEVASMQEKGVIRQVNGNPDGAVSPFWARPKAKPGQWRPILSMKKINKFIRYVKFKMTTVKKMRTWLRPDYYMTSLDLSDAYFSIPLHGTVYKFVRFVWRDLTYEYMTNMFGLGPSARLFTKVLAPVVRFLRKTQKALMVGYIDDFLQQDKDKEECARKTRAAVIIFFCLGFKVNGDKSEIEPVKKIQYLGLNWNTETMTVELPEKKVTDIENRATKIRSRGGCSLQEWKSFIGKLEATRSAVITAPLHFRHLQALIPRGRNGEKNRNRFIPLTKDADRDLAWWIAHMRKHTSSSLSRQPCDLTIRTDASGLWGWGGHSSRGITQQQWKGREVSRHINWKEMEAARGCLQDKMKDGEHILLEMESTVAVSFINKMGGTRSAPLRDKAIEIWNLVLEKKGWITARWIPREQNQMADLLSKESLQTWEFGLNQDSLNKVTRKWGIPTMDLFASKNFHVTSNYCSVEADAAAAQIDAFRLQNWPHWSYAFPPLPLLDLTLERIIEQKIKAIVVMPLWTQSLWWSKVETIREGQLLNLGWYRNSLQPLAQRKLPRLGYITAALLNGQKWNYGTKPGN